MLVERIFRFVSQFSEWVSSEVVVDFLLSHLDYAFRCCMIFWLKVRFFRDGLLRVRGIIGIKNILLVIAIRCRLLDLLLLAKNFVLVSCL